MWLIRISVFAVAFAISAAEPSLSLLIGDVGAARADDDGGSDGGGGGGGGGSDGGGGSGSSSSDGSGGTQDWIARSMKSNRAGKKVRCRCGGFLGLVCSCRAVASRPRRAPSQVEKSVPAKAVPAKTVPRQAVATEIVAVGLSEAELARLQADGFTVVGRIELTSVPGIAARLRAPGALDANRALRRAREAAGGGTIARNDLFRRQPQGAYKAAGRACGRNCESFELTAWTDSVGRCSRDALVGVIDTTPDLEHPSLRDKRVHVASTRSADRRPADMTHGTGVVSLLVGDESSGVAGLAPNASVIVADAFHAGAEGDAADTFDLIAALELLLLEGVGVINMSLSGPDNEALRRVVASALDTGATVVAAAGRPDGGSRLGFPGRYDGVITVAAVDGRMRASRLSSRGQHISFAAPGVGVLVASAQGGQVLADGTSFAAPFVSAAYAMARTRQRSTAEVTDLLSRGAKDLGATGRDAVFGWGLIQYTSLPPC